MNNESNVLYFLILIAAGVGWIINIIELAHSEAINGMVILRAIGIFVFPLGSILGYL